MITTEGSDDVGQGLVQGLVEGRQGLKYGIKKIKDCINGPGNINETYEHKDDWKYEQGEEIVQVSGCTGEGEGGPMGWITCFIITDSKMYGEEP